ncbi:hypothetical protein FQZ97_897380 [compost metagenome]
MITGRVTRATGSCMMPRISTASASRPAAGTPLTTRPTPISSIWMNAMPTTPWATARMVAVHSSASSGPRSGPEMRVAMATAVPLPLSPLAMISPAIASARMNTSTPAPTPASCVSTVLLTSLTWGATCCQTQPRSLDAWVQMRNSGSPTTGHSCTLTGGGGISRLWPWTLCMLFCTDSAMDAPRKPSGVISPASPSTTSKVAARPERPPSMPASR